MKYSVIVHVLVGFLCMVITGCGMSESGVSQESKLSVEKVETGANSVTEGSQAFLVDDRNEYVEVVEAKLIQLNDDHAKLVDRAQQAGSGTQLQADLDTMLNELTKQGIDAKEQINELKSAKVEEWLALQSGMNTALEELAQSYDQALAKSAG